MRTWLLLAIAVFVLAGCSQPASAPEQAEKEDVERAADEKPSVPADVPAYTVTKDEKEALVGLQVRSVSASTDASSEKDLEAITRELWADTDTKAMVVTFYPNEPTADMSGQGQAFTNADAARVFMSSQYAASASANVEDEVRQAMANDGVFVVSIQDEVDAFNEEMCAEWEVTTMGTPPPEMDCPGY